MTTRFHIHSFDTLPSTQIKARETCQSGKAKPGDVFYAAQQTASYGRRGRPWQSPPGNLPFTLIEAYQPENLSWLGYAMGLGLYDATQLRLSEGGLRLKWPNDLFLNNRKMAGLLLEVVDDNILIGVGMNIAAAPQSDQDTICLNGYTEKPVVLEEFLPEILKHYDFWYQKGIKDGFRVMRDIWLERAIWKDENVTARLGNGQEIEGKFIDLDSNGALVLDVKGVHHNITSADIYLRP